MKEFSQRCGPGDCLIFLTAFKWHPSWWHLHMMVSVYNANTRRWSPRISACCRCCLISEIMLSTCGISLLSGFCIILGERRWHHFFSLVVKQDDFLQVFNDISTSSTNVKFELDLVFYLQYLKLGILHGTKFCCSRPLRRDNNDIETISFFSQH